MGELINILALVDITIIGLNRHALPKKRRPTEEIGVRITARGKPQHRMRKNFTTRASHSNSTGKLNTPSRYATFSCNMKFVSLKLAITYGLWMAFNMLLTLIGSEGTGIYTQLILLVTGFPLSLTSLLCTLDGSFLAVFFAGLLGLTQWCGLSYVLRKRASASVSKGS